MKEKKDSPEKDLKEIEVSNLTKFRVMVKRNYKEFSGNYTI